MAQTKAISKNSKSKRSSAGSSAEAQFSVEPNVCAALEVLDIVPQVPVAHPHKKTTAPKATIDTSKLPERLQVAMGVEEINYSNTKNAASSSARSPKHSQKAGQIIASLQQAQIDQQDELEGYKRLKRRRFKRLIARFCVFALLLMVAPVMIFLCSVVIDRNGNHHFFGYTLYLVVSESMEPEIMVNDCVILKKADTSNLKVGQDIGYINAEGKVVVHRIIKVESDQLGQVQYYTKGINNPSQDQLPVSPSQIVGIRVNTMHALGQTLAFFRSPGGIVVLVLVVVAAIGVFYLAFRFTENIRYVENPKKDGI